MNRENYVNIGCSSNNNYSQHLGVMLYSLLKNCSNPKIIKINLVESDISPENKENILSIVNKFGSHIEFIKPNLSLVKGLKIYRHLSKEAYYRFMLVEKIKAKKLLYLDCDMVVEKDILPLYNSNFNKKVVLAVKDPGVNKWKKSTLGVKDFYFNSGVLLIDCIAWKKNNITRKTIDFIRKNPKLIEFADQDGLNQTLNGKWGELDVRWNVITRIYYNKYSKRFFKLYDYSASEITRAYKDPWIIHYATIIKPWFFLDRHPLKKRYHSYLSKTPWKDYKFPDKNPVQFVKRIIDYLDFYYQKYLFLKDAKKINS